MPRSPSRPTGSTSLIPRFDNAGAELRPSFGRRRVQTLCPSVKVETEDADKAYRLTTESGALDYAGEHVGGEAWRYLERRGGCAEALAAMRDASHYTRGRLSREAVHTLYGRSITLSASRMDKARSCHFAYFMQYGPGARRSAQLRASTRRRSAPLSTT